MFEKEIIPYFFENLEKGKIKISVGAQPNSSPHMGTIETMVLSFALARRMHIAQPEKQISILYEVVETAPAEQKYINGVLYQRSLAYTGLMHCYMPEYIDILEYLKAQTSISYEVRYQHEFNQEEPARYVVKKIIFNRGSVAKKLDRKYGRLRMRLPCPVCGWTDKNCINNIYSNDKIYFLCPEHGKYSICLDEDISCLEYNSPLRNLIRGMVYSQINNSNDYDYQILRITGSDYAGFYQEELRYKIASYLGVDAHRMSMIFYAPLITDWSGAKLSKSLYVQKDAYRDIPDEFTCYQRFKSKFGYNGLDKFMRIIDNWLEHPYMLFRNYSIYYFMKEFDQ